ncbi:MAG: metallophosphoesterase [Verrucomicrobiia bacterium]
MKTKPILRFVVWATVFLLYAPALLADWSFAMLGDTRDDRFTTTNGVSPYLNTIAQKIATLNPNLVLAAGDLINGDDVPSVSLLPYAFQFTNWMSAMQPVYNYSADTGIPIYPVRGNHENHDNEGAPVTALKQAYYDAFSAYVPANGPNDASSGNQQGFSYSFTTNNVTFVAADQYFYYNQTSGLTGYHDLDRSWVIQQFQQTNTPFKVFMAHEPFFQTEGTGEGERFFGTNAAGFQTREDFWNALGTNGVQLYLTGHIHNETVASITNDYGNSIIQLMAGNGGAPLDPVGNVVEPGVNLLYTNALYGFSLATVQADAMTIQYYSLNTNDNSWTVANYVTQISANQTVVPEASSVVLLAPAMMVLMTGRFRKRRRN